MLSRPRSSVGKFVFAGSTLRAAPGIKSAAGAATYVHSVSEPMSNERAEAEYGHDNY
ncbi:MAG TPA: hypothetical protein VIB00_01275 [Pyrinomonadaceae bacterium]